MSRKFEEFKTDMSILLENLSFENIDYPPVAVFWLLMAAGCIFGGYKGIKHLEKKHVETADFEIKEVTVLGKIGEDNVYGNGYTIINKPVKD